MNHKLSSFQNLSLLLTQELKTGIAGLRIITLTLR